MYKFIALLSAAIALALPASAQPLVERFSQTANDALASVEHSDIRVSVITVQDFKRQSNMLLANSLATAIYQQGQCTIVVDDRMLSKGAREGITVDAKLLQDFVLVHELGHCVSHHRQATEFNKLANNEAVQSAMFMNPRILKAAEDRTLTQASYAAIIRSEDNERREELFADAFALLYLCKTNPASCTALHDTIANDRARSTRNGDRVHATEVALNTALSKSLQPDLSAPIVYVARDIMASISDI